MPLYAILLNPGHNRVYFEAAKQLSSAEFAFVSQSLSVPCADVDVKDISGIPYLVFTAASPLTAEDIRLLSCLSFAYALFEASPEEPMVLYPVDFSRCPFVPEKISTLLKYSGKTNELFTRLMINVARAVSGFSSSNPMRLLDPMAGKGTTLFEALTLGFDVWGIEQNKKYAEETVVFLKKFLETERLKHSVSTETLHIGQNGKAHKTSFTVARNRAEQKEGGERTICIVAGDARNAELIAKKNRFHILICDLPYGIQHGCAEEKSAARNPKSLLLSCLSGWHRVLLSGGVMVLAWNTFVLPKKEIGEAVTAAGFTLITPDPPNAFAHRVDQAIHRDILIAKKL